MIAFKQSLALSVFTLIFLFTLGALLELEKFQLADKPPRTYPGMLSIADTELGIEIARTQTARRLGLSGRTSLPQNAGMLFVFEESGMYAIWMKDMNFHIDVIWIDKNGMVVGTEERLSPKSYPASFPPPSPVRYILEVNTGFVRQNQIRAGDSVSFSGSLVR